MLDVVSNCLVMFYFVCSVSGADVPVQGTRCAVIVKSLIVSGLEISNQTHAVFVAATRRRQEKVGGGWTRRERRVEWLSHKRVGYCTRDLEECLAHMPLR